jgi:putative ABC transport system permease protein
MWRIALTGLVRTPARTAVRVVVLAVAVALLGSMLLFIGHSLRTMAASAIRSVPLDWQGPVSSYRQARSVATGVATQRGIAQASPTATAPLLGAVHSARGATTSAGVGAILAVPPDYLAHIETFRYLRGSLHPGNVVLDQQLAATLQAQVGDTVRLSVRRGARPIPFTVSGVALVTAPDVLFQPLNPLVGPAPAQPPANIAILPLDTFARTLAPELHAIAPASVGSSAVPGAQTGVQWQVQVQVYPSGLGTTPGQASTRAGQTVRRVERSLPGQVQFVDNLSDQLNTASADALYAETLYIMLALPGTLIALGLGYLAALGTVESDRRDLALLRARGATRRSVFALAWIESVGIGV